MPDRYDLTLRQLRDEASRYAQFYFAPDERARVFADLGQPSDGTYVVVARNQFVPLDSLSGCSALLRKFVRAEKLDEGESSLLNEYWDCLKSSQAQLIGLLESGGLNAGAKAQAQDNVSWPAVGFAESEAALRELMVKQFEQMRRSHIPWRGVDSSTQYFATRDGVCVLVVWFWHGTK